MDRFSNGECAMGIRIFSGGEEPLTIGLVIPAGYLIEIAYNVF